ncbi:MAG: phage replisome organizer N-terminal domain-containing protein [Clostridia bacterium]|nr:phage replisome organizer N-terminal domain-containing protein [Clostridia bacterium]
MKENKKFYWLKLKDDFFNTTEIKIMKGLPNGKDYIILLLQLRLLSINHDGLLQYNEYIPYDINTLASLTDTNIDIVRTGIKLFEEMKLLSILDNGTFFMQKVNELVGSETKWAEYKREKRKLENEGQLSLKSPKNNLENVQEKSTQNIGQCPTRDKSIENKIIDFNNSYSNNRKEDEKLLQIKNIFLKYLKYTTATIITECYKEFSTMDITVIESAFIKSAEKDGSWLYAKTILKSWKIKNILTVEDVENERQEFEKSKNKITSNHGNKFYSNAFDNIDLEKFYDNL